MSTVFVLIDDDIDDKELFQEALGSVDSNIICFCAGDGEEALLKLANGDFLQPSVLFVDINLPEMSGWEVLTKIKSDDRHKHLPVIMYSTSSHKRDKNIALDLGAVCLITKPNDYKTLREILAMVSRTLTTKEDINSIADQIPSH